MRIFDLRQIRKYKNLTSLFVIGVVIAISGLAYKNEQSEIRKEASRVNTEQAIAACSSGSDSVPDFSCVIEHTKTQKDQKHTAADLRAQQEMAVWAFLMLIVSATGVIFVALTLIEAQRTARFALKTLRLTHKSTQASIKSAEAAERSSFSEKALIFVEYKVRSQFAKHPQTQFEFMTKVTFELVNYGKTPAIITDVNARLYWVFNPLQLPQIDPGNVEHRKLAQDMWLFPMDEERNLLIPKSFTRNIDKRPDPNHGERTSGGSSQYIIPSNGTSKISGTHHFEKPELTSRTPQQFAGFLGGTDTWFQCIVKYRDVYGHDRETGYFTKLFNVDSVDRCDPEHANKYNYWK